MLRLFILPVVLLALFAVACGGDDDESDGTPDAGAVTDGPAPTATPQLLPTPPRANEEDVILFASAGQTAYEPTLKEFRDLPRTKIKAQGDKEGVSLKDLAAKVSAPSDVFVTVQGFRTDGRVIQFVRQPLADIGAESVLMVDDTGRLRLVSSKLPESEWLVNVTVVSFP